MTSRLVGGMERRRGREGKGDESRVSLPTCIRRSPSLRLVVFSSIQSTSNSLSMSFVSVSSFVRSFFFFVRESQAAQIRRIGRVQLGARFFFSFFISPKQLKLF